MSKKLPCNTQRGNHNPHHVSLWSSIWKSLWNGFALYGGLTNPTAWVPDSFHSAEADLDAPNEKPWSELKPPR